MLRPVYGSVIESILCSQIMLQSAPRDLTTIKYHIYNIYCLTTDRNTQDHSAIEIILAIR